MWKHGKICAELELFTSLGTPFLPAWKKSQILRLTL